MAPTGDEVVKKFAAEITGKTFLITGPSEGGIGAQTAIYLAAGKPKLIILAGRDKAKIQPVIDQIATNNPDVPVNFVSLDLSSQASIRETAKQINSQINCLDVLINNAGVMAVRSHRLTVEGIEMQFGVNHIGHFLLTSLLMDKIVRASKGARIINLSSLGYIASGLRDDWDFKKEAYNPWLAYAQSKTSNILFSSSLAKRLKSKAILVFSVNPGYVPETKLQADITKEMLAQGYVTTLEALKDEPIVPMEPISLAEGAATALYAALDPDLAGHSGAFLSDLSLYTHLKPQAVGEENESKLWALSEGLIGEKFNALEVI